MPITPTTPPDPRTDRTTMATPLTPPAQPTQVTPPAPPTESPTAAQALLLPLPPLPRTPPTNPPQQPPSMAAPRAPPTQDKDDDTTITITTYNVVSARGTRLLQALRAMDDLNTDIAVLTETKLCRGRHARKGFGYTVMATDAPSPSKGGIALAWRTTARHWSLEGVRPLSPNSITATLVSGAQRWLLLGTYLTPNAPPDTELDILEAEHRRYPTLPVILMGDLNADIDNVDDERCITIATSALQLGTNDIFHRSPQKNKRRFTRHKTMRNGTHQRTRCDYALVDTDVPVQSLRLIIPPRFHSDHWAIKLEINSSSDRLHNRYIYHRTQLPRIPALPDEGGPNRLFKELLSLCNRPRPTNYPPRDAWITTETWALIDQRNAALKRLAPQEELRPLRKAIRKGVRRDRATRLQQTGEAIQAHLDADETREAWRLVKVWYRHQAPATPPTPTDMHNMEAEYRALYTATAQPGEPIRGMVTYIIPDQPPNDDELEGALRSLHSGRAPGPSGMTVEALKKWHEERDANPRPWAIIQQLVAHAFSTGVVPSRARANTLVLIPKPEPGQFRGIGLQEPVWKLISAIINRRLMDNIRFHDDLHGFLPDRGTGTACLEAKLEAQLAIITGRPLHHIYLDFTKAYDSLDRERTLTLLQDYGVGPQMLRIISHFWERHMMIPRQQAVYGEPFPARRGLATGDIAAPGIFNIVTDAILRRWYADIATQGLTTRARFYADNGALRDHDTGHLQQSLTIMEDLFARVGLAVNGNKTKSLTNLPKISTTNLSTVAYKRRMEGTGDTYRERKKRRTTCDVCATELQIRNLRTHYKSHHPTIPVPLPDEPLPPIQYVTPVVYFVTEPNKHADMQCPVPGCGVTVVGGWYNLRHHFAFRHQTVTLTIIKEGELPSCTSCGFQCALPHDRHQQSEMCAQGTEKRRRLELTQKIIYARDHAQVMTAGATNLAQVNAFKYLGRWMTADDTDDRAVSENISKARARWGQLCCLLTRQGASPSVMGYFYKATVQAVLLFGAKTWSLTQPLLRRLCSFHHRCARYLTRRPMTQLDYGTWISPPSAEVLEQAGLHTIEEYIARRLATFLPFIQSCIIYRECHAAGTTQVAVNHPRWWASLLPPPVPTHATTTDIEPEPRNQAAHDGTDDTQVQPPHHRRSARLTITV